MKVDWAFLRLVIYCYIVCLVLTFYPISEFANEDIVKSILGGTIMSFVNILLGYFAIEYSFERSHTTFLKFVLCGMVIRLILMWTVFLILIHFYKFHAASLILSLLFFYIMNLVLEIYYLQKRVSTKK